MSKTIPYVPIIKRIASMAHEQVEFGAPDECVNDMVEIKKLLSDLAKEIEARKDDAESRAKIAASYKRNSVKAYEEGRAIVYSEMLDILKGEQ